MILEAYGKITPEQETRLIENYYSLHLGTRDGVRKLAIEKNINIYSSKTNFGEKIIEDIRRHRSNEWRKRAQDFVVKPCENEGDLQTLIIRLNNLCYKYNDQSEDFQDFLMIISNTVIPFKLRGITLINELENQTPHLSAGGKKHIHTNSLELLYTQYQRIVNAFLEVQYNARLKNAAIILHLFLKMIGLKAEDAMYFVTELNTFSWDHNGGEILMDYLENFVNKKKDIFQLLDEIDESDHLITDFRPLISSLDEKDTYIENYRKDFMAEESSNHVLFFGDHMIPCDTSPEVYGKWIIDLANLLKKRNNGKLNISPLTENTLGFLQNRLTNPKCICMEQDGTVHHLIEHTGIPYILYGEMDGYVHGISLYENENNCRRFIKIAIDKKSDYVLTEGKVGDFVYGGIQSTETKTDGETNL